MAITNSNRSDNGGESKPVSPGGTHFVEKMLSGFGHDAQAKPGSTARGTGSAFHPLRQKKAPASVEYHLPARRGGTLVRADSPAVEVMTDLTEHDAVTIAAGVSVDEANHVMIRHRVRSLFVVSDEQTVIGIITATDVLGERPVQIAQERELRHSEVLVHQVMTPAAQLEVIELQDVLQARVGDIVETLRHSGRQHALVVESVNGATPAHTVRGIFSLTQIARQLGLPAHVGRVARTFAEIEAAIAN